MCFIDAGPVSETHSTSIDPSFGNGEPDCEDEDNFEDAELDAESGPELPPDPEPRLVRSSVTFNVSAVFHAANSEDIENCPPEDSFSARPLPTGPAPPRPPRLLSSLQWFRSEPPVGSLPAIREEDFSPVDLSVDLE